MTVTEVINDHFLEKYRMLSDAEDAAFDEMEHAYEDGDREHFEADLAMWMRAAKDKHEWLVRHGVVT